MGFFLGSQFSSADPCVYFDYKSLIVHIEIKELDNYCSIFIKSALAVWDPLRIYTHFRIIFFYEK